MGGVEAPWRQKTVPVLIDHEGGQVIVYAAVFEAILIVGEDVNEVVPPVVSPWHCPLAGSSRVIVRILAATAIPPFQVARRVDHQTGMAQAVSHRLGRQAEHFA